jgi:cell division transport system permease protein
LRAKTPFFYCLGQGFVNIRRNKVFFAASVATIAACIFLIGLFVAVTMNMNFMVTQMSENVCVTIFFDEGMSEEEINDIGSKVETWSEVDRIEFTSAEEAWEKFREDYFAEYPDLAEGFAGDNPLANSASYDIYLNDISLQPQIVSRLEGIDGVRQVNKSETAASTLTDLGKIVGVVSLALIAVLLAVSVFLITNTIITGITLRKEELQIMKYVGATDFFVKSPFVFEGIIIGIIGALIPLVVLFFIYRSAMGFFMEQFQVVASVFTFMPLWDIFKVLIPVAFIIGAGIGFVGSTIATERHIKV